MKKFKLSFAYLAVFAMIFTSCSKEENSIDEENSVVLTFGAVLNDLANRASTKAHFDDIPTCSDAAPDRVVIGLTVDGIVWDDVEVDILSDSNGYFTAYTDDLKIQITDANGVNVQLTKFMVYDANNNIIWVAPAGGNFAGYVDNALPLDFNLQRGTKPYINVEVLCFDRRLVNEYGYPFFDIDQNRAIQLCLFGNYCDDNGRHYTAAYTVDVWSYSNGQKGTQIYNDLANTVSMNAAGDYESSPLCLALPDREGMDEYYFEITLRNSDAYSTVEERIIRAGVINDGDVRDLMDDNGSSEYYHFQAGNCSDAADSPELLDADIYYSGLSSLNNSGVSGFASLIHMDNKLTVKIWADGLTPNMVHPQHIHGLESDANATCPPAPGSAEFMAADTNGDGVIDLVEGLPFYGPVLLELYEPIDEFPVANADGEIHFERTFTLGVTEFEEEGMVPTWEELAPLVNRTIVLHGMFFQGEYDASLPVACGQIQWVYEGQ